MLRLQTVPRYLRHALRKRPKTIAIVVLLILIGSGAGFYLYALSQWHGAQVAVKENRFAEARNKLELCLYVWPRNVEVHLLAARSARLMGDFESAEAHLNRCLKLQKGASEATQIEFLLMRAQSGEEDEVSPVLFPYVENGHPESALILETLARAYMHRFRYGPAYAVLNSWIEIAPNSARPYQWRGWVLERLNDSKGALADYLRALEFDPNLADVRLHVGELYLQDNSPVEAIRYFEPLNAQFPNRADVRARLGQCRYLQGRTEEALRLLESAVEKLPDDPAVLLYLAKLDIDRMHPDVAEVRLKHALKIDPSDLESRYTLVSALQLQNRSEEAVLELKRLDEQKAIVDRANKLLREEAEHPSKSPDLPSEIGAALLKFGLESQGLYWLDQALARDPNHQPTLKVLAEYYESQGQPEKAKAHRRKLLSTP